MSRRTTRPSRGPAIYGDEDDDFQDPPTTRPTSQKVSASAGRFAIISASPMGDLRKGKWVPEEEVFANRIIKLFNLGLLAIPTGTTLRSHLSEKLSCDPMRITKKFAGASCIGKQVYQPKVPADRFELEEALEDLSHLEQAFHFRLRGRGVVQRPRDRAHSSAMEYDTGGDFQGDGDDEGEDYDFYDSDPASSLLASFTAPSSSSSSSSAFSSSSLWQSGNRQSSPSSGGGGGMQGFGRRILSAPDLQAYGYDASRQRPPLAAQTLESYRRVRAPVVLMRDGMDMGIGAGRQGERLLLKRSKSTVDLEDFHQFVGDDSAAAQLFVGFMSKLSNEQGGVGLSGGSCSSNSSSSSSSSVSGGGGGKLARGDSFYQASEPFTSLDTMAKSETQSVAPFGEERSSISGSRSASEAGSGGSDNAGGQSESRSCSGSRSASVVDGMLSASPGEALVRKESRDSGQSHSPVGLMMDDFEAAVLLPPEVPTARPAALGVFGSMANRG